MKRQSCKNTFITGFLIILLGWTGAAQAATNTLTWTGESTFEGPRHTGSSTATGTVTKTKEGVTWEAERQGVVDGGKTWQSTTTGSGSKTADGYELQKSGNNANIKRKSAVDTQPTTSGGQKAKKGFFSKSKRSTTK